ncbi:MAG: CoA activase [Thermodesulfobacteriota bacterium]|nr:CoA activase [Thermodesulfobacteriota bacterium]
MKSIDQFRKTEEADTFDGISQGVGHFDVKGKTFLIPEMNRIGSHLMAGVFRGFGINAFVMDTYKGIDMGKEHTSGKECFPCIVTLGDILLYMKKEEDRLGDTFNPENYMYFMPEAGGPCRFGMYNKLHRIILDSIGGLGRLKIATLTSEDSYSLNGLIPKEKVRGFRKAAYLSVIIGDVLDRLLWRIRPYEKKKGEADVFIANAMERMTEFFAGYSSKKNFTKILNELEEIVRKSKEIVDPNIPKKPIVAVVGEIYVRSHFKTNQDTIRMLEKYGAEAVNASVGEWINYTTYDQARLAKIDLKLNLRKLRIKEIKDSLFRYLNYSLTLFYQYIQQRKVFRLVMKYIDIQEDHKIGHLEKTLKNENAFSFEIGTEACLSIPAALEYAHTGFNGVVNIFPFTCMPSNLTSSIAKPLMSKLHTPYLDVSYDGSFQPGREPALRTFMYQVYQHFKTNGRV